MIARAILPEDNGSALHICRAPQQRLLKVSKHSARHLVSVSEEMKAGNEGGKNGRKDGRREKSRGTDLSLEVQE